MNKYREFIINQENTRNKIYPNEHKSNKDYIKNPFDLSIFNITKQPKIEENQIHISHLLNKRHLLQIYQRPEKLILK